VNKRFWSRKRKYTEINPDEILLDSSNIPNFDTHQLEGRLEKPIGLLSLYSLGVILTVVFVIFAAQAWNLQIANGENFKLKSENNMLRPVPIFAGRGVVYDRNDTLLIWNAPNETDSVIAHREYATSSGLAHVLGYVQYPSKDKNGFYYRDDFEGVDGVEQYFNEALQGKNGSRLVEVDAQGNVLSENTVRPPEQGENLHLSIDSRVQAGLYANIKDISQRVGFSGGAGVIMNVNTGELVALTSYPEYSPQVMSDASDTPAIRATLNNTNLPFLDRAVDGLYTPGSIVKPYLALGALDQKTIDPEKVVHESGSISVANPYDPTKTSVFKDWKDLGFLDMRRAIAMSSDVYFYIVGGGYKGQKGLGISNIDKYLSLFGFGSKIPDSFASGKSGTIPTPEWKKKTFNESWFLGDTYHTAIGQYGTLVTPVQAVRAVSAIANNGKLMVPTILSGKEPHVEKTVPISSEDFEIVREGMRQGVENGITGLLNVPFTKVASKSGTAELGESRSKVNSWITGFWPYENPKYAFAVLLEKGSATNIVGATTAFRQQLDWMNEHTPEYFSN
jgi:penicillin-binding protein 2